MKEICLERLKDLVLARLSVGGKSTRRAKGGKGSKRPPTPADLGKALYPLVQRRVSAPEWKRLLERALASLRAEQLIESERLVITPAGAARLAAALGSKPSRPARDWREFRLEYLPRLVFDALPAAREGAARPSAAVLAQRLGVTPSSKSERSARTAELAGVVDTWLCATLGLPAKQPLTLSALRGALLARELGLPARPLAQVTGVAIATLSGATSGNDDAVSDAYTLRWLFDEPPPRATKGQGERNAPSERNAPAPPVANAAASLERIAAKALQAAGGPEARRFGPDKVFIGSVWRALSDDPEIAELGEAGFKHQLAEAHRRGLLELGRADLVAAMDPSELAASEVTHRNATYHFILGRASA